MFDARAAAIAEVERELAEMDAVAAAVENGLGERHRRGAAASTAFSLRLDPGELSALERRAAALQMKPSVLARNLIRIGLRGIADADRDRDVLDAVDRVDAAVAELRSLIT